MPVDYSLYMVTDGTPAILGDRNLEDVVISALKGGVTVVQYRDKISDTGLMIANALALGQICHRYRVPLIINDRIDVAIASGAQGVHLGQTDMDPLVARQLLGPQAIIGVTVSNIAEAGTATRAGADYLGIGTVYPTPTKENTNAIIGTSGVQHILRTLYDGGCIATPTVAIGGINAKNVQRVMYKSSAIVKSLDGVAVVSAITAADNPENAARELRRLIEEPPIFVSGLPLMEMRVEELLESANDVIKDVAQKQPICHNMTNLVVQNIAANVAIAIGASPIMANNGDEAAEIAVLSGALVINMGSVNPAAIDNYVKATQAYNACGQPVLFDPVGAGATTLRRDAVQTLLGNGYYEVIKGNESEIRELLGDTTAQQRGVDSGVSTSSEAEKARLASKLALQERNIVVITGKTDYISDGMRVFSIKNGSSYLCYITGSGCTLGTTIAACLAAHMGDPLLATVAGMLMFEIASEKAGLREDVKGPGTFVPAFIDELHNITKLAGRSDRSWLANAQVTDVSSAILP
ncbi:MAG: hypothetical protein LQ345_005677 [Seirophora villosa]|nr:MAG: hypothetical protein LQ345_005677 [Seirophora villosa]